MKDSIVCGFFFFFFSLRYYVLATEFSKRDKDLTQSKYRSFGWETVLCHIRSFNDGSFEMKPGFSAPSRHKDGVFDPKEWYTITTPHTRTRLCYRIENVADSKGQV